MSLSRKERRAAERASRKVERRQLAAAPAVGFVPHKENFKHGLYTKQLILKGEDPSDLAALKAALFNEHKPGTETEALLVQELAEHYWLMKRYRRYETELLSMEPPQAPEAETAQRMHGRCERSFYKALKMLRELQKDRKREERSTGFVPSKTVAAGNSEVVSRGFVPKTEIGETNGFVPSNLP